MLAAGAELDDAMRVANRAAGIVVGKLGTAAATRDELVREPAAKAPGDYIVTGAAGFIGSNLVEGAQRARRAPTSSPSTTSRSADKFKNLADLRDRRLSSTRPSSSRASSDGDSARCARCSHQGACSDTMETDGRYMMENNYRYSTR